jgi:hypothetical protein
MWKPRRAEPTKPSRQRLDRLALAILKQAAIDAKENPIRRLPAHRLALAWLTYTDVASPDQASSFWSYLGHANQYGGPDGQFYRQCDPKWMLEAWQRRAGLSGG